MFKLEICNEKEVLKKKMKRFDEADFWTNVKPIKSLSSSD